MAARCLTFERQVAELQVRIAVPNSDTALGIPITEPAGSVRPGKGKVRTSADLYNKAPRGLRLRRPVLGCTRTSGACHSPPPLPTIVQGLVETVLHGGIAPPQAIAIDEDYARQDAPVINALLPCDFGKQGSSRAFCASVSQKRLLMSPLAFRAVNQTVKS